jgi:DNA invertase Pin-like site-specific DNA recombinase
MNIAQYARVSLEAQDSGDRASIAQQLTAMDELCERRKWQVIEVFIDRENYKATQSPKKGKSVNPSGERADRPAFVNMLETIKSGEIDIVLCWRDDRLVRHPRVAVALEDALDIGDSNRINKPKIEIRDATGAMIDRFTLSIKATIWREENKRRAERAMMGKSWKRMKYPSCQRSLRCTILVKALGMLDGT